MTSMSSTVASTVAAPQVGPPPASVLEADDLAEEDLSVERRKEMLERLPNHLRPWERNS